MISKAMFFLSPSKRQGGSASGEAISWLSTLDYSPSTCPELVVSLSNRCRRALDYWVVLSLSNGLEYNLQACPELVEWANSAYLLTRLA